MTGEPKPMCGRLISDFLAPETPFRGMLVYHGLGAR